MSKNNFEYGAFVLGVMIFLAFAMFSTVNIATFASAANGTHLACVSNTCTIINGSGNDTCSPVGSSCGNSTNQTHLACVNQACVSVAGSGSNLCTSNANCQSNQTTHLACVNDMCSVVSGAGNNTCSFAGGPCGPPTNNTHLACVNMACQMVSYDTGNNTCSSDAQCGHNVCNYVNKTCSRVAGAGTNQCDLGERCSKATIGGKVNATRLSPAVIASIPQCSSWFKRVFSKSCKAQIAAAQAQLQ